MASTADAQHRAVIKIGPRAMAQRDPIYKERQEAQLSPSDRAMRLVSSNIANCHATVQKLLIRQVLTKLLA